MYILLTDETNRTHAGKAKFFVYGGLIVGIDQVPVMHTRIAQIREHFGYKPQDTLKFDTNSRPVHVTPDVAAEAKRQVIRACIDSGCKFIAHVVHHEIARTQEIQTVVEWGANQVIGKFQLFLTLENSYGIVAMDRLPDGVEFGYLAGKFSNGLTFESEPPVALDRITLLSSTCVNASHLASAMDIVLGAWRYCINDPKNVDAAQQMMGDITRLLWCRREGDTLHAAEKGLVFRPKNIVVQKYKDDYIGLLAHINELIKDF